MKKYKIAFICVHNSCRSQMAEALTKLFFSDKLIPYSAGTMIKDQINPDAVRIMKEKYGVDMTSSQRSKLLEDIPEVDIVITMGCNVDCPYLPCKYREDFGLDDPSHQPDIVFYHTIDLILTKLTDLVKRIENGEINL